MMESPEDGRIQPTKGFIDQEVENVPELAKRKMKVQREEMDGRTTVCGSAEKPSHERTALPDLSKKDLLHLLGVMEGEVQVP